MPSRPARPATARRTTPQPPEVAPGTLTALFGHLVRRAQGHLYGEFQARFGDAGVTPGQFAVLLAVAEAPAASQAALARQLALERATLGEAIDALASGGWIERKRSGADRRSFAVHLSASGRSLVHGLLPRIRRLEQRLLRGFSARELATARDVLRALGEVQAPGYGRRSRRRLTLS